MTEAEAITAYSAARKLTKLYHAYRATYRANAMMLHKIQGQLSVDTGFGPEARTAIEQGFVQRKSYAQEMDLSFRLRLQQLTPRLAELRAWQP